MQGETTYGANGTTTRVSGTGPSISPFLADYVARRLRERTMPAAPPAAPLVAAPLAPPTYDEPATVERRPPAQAPRVSNERHAFVANNHGMNQIGGYSEAPEGTGNFYGGYRVTDGNPGVHFANMASRANTDVADSAAPAAAPSAMWTPPKAAPGMPAAAAASGGAAPAGDWYSLPGFVRDKILASGNAQYWAGR